MKQNDTSGQKRGYALITGASSGIGREFAVCLAREGYPLILVARRKDRLKKLAKRLTAEYGCVCIVLAADLQDLQACYGLFEQIREYPLEILVNNAGFGDCGAFVNADPQKDMAMVDVNVKAMHLLMKLALHKWKAQTEWMSHPKQDRSGRYHAYILNVASSAGLLPAGPYMAAYYATKAYAASLTQAVAEELRQMKFPVYVGCLCPGPVDTEFNHTAGVKSALPGISARKCAEYGILGMKKGKTLIVPSLKIKFVVMISRFLPRNSYIRLTARQQKKKLR